MHAFREFHEHSVSCSIQLRKKPDARAGFWWPAKSFLVSLLMVWLHGPECPRAHSPPSAAAPAAAVEVRMAPQKARGGGAEGPPRCGGVGGRRAPGAGRRPPGVPPPHRLITPHGRDGYPNEAPTSEPAAGVAEGVASLCASSGGCQTETHPTSVGDDPWRQSNVCRASSKEKSFISGREVG